MRRFASLLMLALTPMMATAQTAENPYDSVSAPELRSKLAHIDPVQQQSWYQVEVLVFARTGPTTQEYWRLDQRPHLAPENAIHPASDAPLLPENDDSIDISAAAIGAWKTLPADQLILTDMLGRMEKSGSYRLLYHEGWVQPVRERSQAFPIYLSGGDQVPLTPAPGAMLDDSDSYGLPPIEPSDSTPATSAVTGADAGSAAAGAAVPTTQPELQGMIRLHLSRYLHVEPNIWFARTSDTGQPYWVHIDQNRRMRSEELHYIDHPLFGMLIRITPYQTPAQKEIEQMQDALKNK